MPKLGVPAVSFLSGSEQSSGRRRQARLHGTALPTAPRRAVRQYGCLEQRSQPKGPTHRCGWPHQSLSHQLDPKPESPADPTRRHRTTTGQKPGSKKWNTLPLPGGNQPMRDRMRTLLHAVRRCRHQKSGPENARQTVPGPLGQPWRR